jgi:phage terminase large subunit-like protein
MNIRLNYLYRDGANYKNYVSVVCSNNDHLSFAEIREHIQKASIDGVWFYAKKWGLKELHLFPYDSELDHEWHEFEGVVETEEEATQGDISTLLKLIVV